MRRILPLSAVLMALLILPACGITDALSEDDGGAFVLNEQVLLTSVLRFTNPSPNTSIGEEPEWEYTFVSGAALGCNANNSFTSTGWTTSGNSIRVNFGSAFENYELRSASGSLQDGTFRGDFHLTSSVPGNVVDGTFRQVSTTKYC